MTFIKIEYFLVSLVLSSLLLAPSLSAAYDKTHSLHGVKSSFLLGKIGPHTGDQSKKFNTTLMYLSNTWTDTERRNFRQRLVNTGDTHIDMYVRATRGHLPGGVVNPNDDFRQRLVELNKSGLKPVLWMTPESAHNDWKGDAAHHKAFMEKIIRLYDDQASAYVACLECDEYWSPEQVNDYVAFIKSKTNKPVAVHLADGVGGYKHDTRYYTNADYIYLQIGGHTTGDYIADTETAKRMLTEALTLGKPVVVSEYSLFSESAQAKALGDLMCSMGAVGTGNGRNITYCGHEDVPKKKKDYTAAILGLVGVGIAAYYLTSNYDISFTFDATEDWQSYGMSRSFSMTERLSFDVNATHYTSDDVVSNKIFFGFSGTF